MSTFVAFHAALETSLFNLGPQIGGFSFTQIQLPSAAISAEPLLHYKKLMSTPHSLFARHAEHQYCHQKGQHCDNDFHFQLKDSTSPLKFYPTR